MTTVEALHELRRMAQPTCWRCEGTGVTLGRVSVSDWWKWGVVSCPSCTGTGQPERVA